MCQFVILRCPCALCVRNPTLGAVNRINICLPRQRDLWHLVAPVAVPRPPHDLGSPLACPQLEYFWVASPSLCAHRPPAPAIAAPAAAPMLPAQVPPTAAAAAPAGVVAGAGPSAAAPAPTNITTTAPTTHTATGRKLLPSSRPKNKRVRQAVAAAATRDAAALPAAFAPIIVNCDWAYVETIRLLLLRSMGMEVEEISKHLPRKDAAGCAEKLKSIAIEMGYEADI
ncbi:hypothetical protein C8A05DRAFT_34083 [Staphylotrichum tortipilum]|uniref:Uncharacterized protein n=1 Tax=Staphylotrichum tortipilum TaxID=2831512 RepID=A0AAN6MLV8_9PEZI|nr:hypothetical protein C8A05DRAFT_34083 [Staphylotrichum longicolle]